MGINFEDDFLNIETVAEKILLINESRFSSTANDLEFKLKDLIKDRHILILGACSFIAKEIYSSIFECQPKKIYFLDFNENGLAELARSIQLGNFGKLIPTYEIKLIDINSNWVYKFISGVSNIDLLLNFAANKHVRSERDQFSMAQMISTNIISPYLIYKNLLFKNSELINFTISTDKAAQPKNIMGASKRIMEITQNSLNGNFRTTRFANVAFSTGSLLESWLIRLKSHQPLSVPIGTERYFVTPKESGQICTSAMTLDNKYVCVPSDGILSSHNLQDTLVKLLELYDLKPEYVENLEDANKILSGSFALRRFYPVILTNLDTQGEKNKETFYDPTEILDTWNSKLTKIKINSEDFQQDLFEYNIKEIYKNALTRDTLINFISLFLPDFILETNSLTLDNRI